MRTLLRVAGIEPCAPTSSPVWVPSQVISSTTVSALSIALVIVPFASGKAFRQPLLSSTMAPGPWTRRCVPNSSYTASQLSGALKRFQSPALKASTPSLACRVLSTAILHLLWHTRLLGWSCRRLEKVELSTRRTRQHVDDSPPQPERGGAKRVLSSKQQRIRLLAGVDVFAESGWYLDRPASAGVADRSDRLAPHFWRSVPVLLITLRGRPPDRRTRHDRDAVGWSRIQRCWPQLIPESAPLPSANWDCPSYRSGWAAD